MQQRFHTRNISIRDFEQWDDRGELVLQPRFQRRNVWKPMAKSYLIDTIVRGKPIPKLFMRQDINPRTRKTTREIVDGQQRLRTVLSFLKDEFKISRVHNKDFAGSKFSDLDPGTQGDILKYEFVVDLLEDMPDQQVRDVFARINTYVEKLNAQEIRNATYLGDFKTSAYSLANEAATFFETNKIFTPQKIIRMAECEFVSELLLAIHEGIREGKKSVIDKAYREYDNKFPMRDRHEKRAKETIDLIGNILGHDLPNTEFRATRMFYPLFCAVYHMQFGLPELQVPRRAISVRDYVRVRTSLQEVSELIVRINKAQKSNEPIQLTAEQRKFHGAYSEYWVHATERTVLTQYLCKQLTK